MPFPRHWTIAMHASRTPVVDKAPQSFTPVDLTAVRAECSTPDPRLVALNLAYLTRGKPLGERRELLEMMGVASCG